jgi:predicted alpha-1,6-mannanase (GH76 family)
MPAQARPVVSQYNSLDSRADPAILRPTIGNMKSGMSGALNWFMLCFSIIAWADATAAPAVNSTNTPDNTTTNRSSRLGRERFQTEPPTLDWSHLPNAEDAATLMAAYNRAFYVKTSTNTGYFRVSVATNKPADFWKLAEEIEMVIDVYEHTRNPAFSNQVVQLIDGFNAHYGNAWTNNEFNDDVMWICIANLRGYQMTGNKRWRDHARTQFEAVYRRAWDTNFFGGGLFWKTENRSKNTCVNTPAAIAACLLWKAYGETAYRDKASAIVDWVKLVLSDGKGWIYDSIRTNGTVSKGSLTYNQGTFIGACNFLGRTNDAAQAANYVMNNQGTLVKDFRILPPYRIRGDLAGFHGIFLRWMTRYMEDQHLQSTYLTWLKANALSAWSVRRASDNLSWCNWMQMTPTDSSLDLPSWACGSSVEAVHVMQK